MREAMAPDSIYLRFFSCGGRSEETEARRICRDPAPGSAALLALRDGDLVALPATPSSSGIPGISRAKRQGYHRPPRSVRVVRQEGRP